MSVSWRKKLANRKRMKLRNRYAVVLAGAVVLLPTTQNAWAQSLTGSIVGNVSDSSGAAVPDAAVTITETGTQQTRSGTTSATGSYDSEAAQPWQYNVKISKAGFVTTTKTQVTLVADTVVRADFTLAVGNVSESVTVSATAAALQTDSAEVAADLGTTQVESVPLSQSPIPIRPGYQRAERRRQATDYVHAKIELLGPSGRV